MGVKLRPAMFQASSLCTVPFLQGPQHLFFLDYDILVLLFMMEVMPRVVFKGCSVGYSQLGWTQTSRSKVRALSLKPHLQLPSLIFWCINNTLLLFRQFLNSTLFLLQRTLLSPSAIYEIYIIYDIYVIFLPLWLHFSCCFDGTFMIAVS